MAQINKPTDHFRIKLYTGNATNDTAITFDESTNMKPDWLWIKNRSAAQSHAVFDSTRGATLRLTANGTGAESTENTNLDSFDTNGFTVDNEAIVNGNGNNMVAWSWKANGGTTSSNTDGSITSTVQANTTAGFSIVSYTGTGANATVGHGLSSAPSVIIMKNRVDAVNLPVYHKSLGATKWVYLSNTDASTTATPMWNDTEPTSSVFSIGTYGNSNGSSDGMIAYCFAEKKGYSKFGSYTGNGNADGTFVYTGFKPAWVMMKGTNTNGWLVIDNKRTAFNSDSKFLYPHAADVEESLSGRFDFLSNGFKLRNTWTAFNSSGQEYIYVAFAQNPFVTSTGIPCTAR